MNATATKTILECLTSRLVEASDDVGTYYYLVDPESGRVLADAGWSSRAAAGRALRAHGRAAAMPEADVEIDFAGRRISD